MSSRIIVVLAALAVGGVGSSGIGCGKPARATFKSVAEEVGAAKNAAGDAAQGGDNWAFWRGPQQNGVSTETNLPSKFSIKEKTNLIWEVPFGGRSTPLVMNGRVYLNNSAGEGLFEQERVMCLDADTGKPIWEKRFNIFHTDIASVRLGWTNLCGDPKTNNVYWHGTQGLLVCFDKDGNTVWQHSLTEEYGRITGYGGRISSPIVDENLVIVGMVNSSWGGHSKGGNRFVAFDKYRGDVVWWSEANAKPATYYSNPVVAVINGERQLISGGADGGVHGLQVRTGKLLWSYTYSKGAINSSPVVSGTKVYNASGEENDDNNIQGRVICVDAGDIDPKTRKPKLIWQRDGIAVKYTSPVIADDKLYICDDVANLYCLNASTGKPLWKPYEYGRSTMGSPVLADGKLYVPDVNAHFQILEPGPKQCKELHDEFFPGKGGVDVEIEGSPAVANGRIHFSTTFATYCIGLKGAKRAPAPQPDAQAFDITVRQEQPAKPAWLQILPADVAIYPGETVTFKARAFDDKGNLIGFVKPNWSLPEAPLPPGAKKAPPALQGTIADGQLTLAKMPPSQQGYVMASFEGVTGQARVRVVPLLPYSQDFEKVPDGATPAGWVNCAGKFKVVTLKDGNKVLAKVNNIQSPLIARANAFVGLPNLTDYTIQADVMGGKVRSDMPDIGVVAARYTLKLDGNKQRLQILSWDGIPRVDKAVNFTFLPDAWYTMKFTIETVGGKQATLRGKVWEKGKAEPAQWTVEFTDPAPNLEGSPALYGYVTGILENEPGTEVYYDNVSVRPNKK